MLPTLLTLSGYLWGVLHDLAAQRGWPRVKPLLFLAMMSSHLAAYYLFLRRAPRLVVPGPLQKSASVVAVAGILGMIYSIMIEIPFRKAWLAEGHSKDLVTGGTYALARHPGVLWAVIWIPALAVAARSRSLLLWWPVVWLGDVLHVWFQDRYTLPRVFGDEYREYQRTTPFLLPTRASVGACIRSFSDSAAE